MEALRSHQPDVTFTGDAQVVRVLKAGARAYVLKAHVVDELLDTIRTVHAGKKRIPRDEYPDHVSGGHLECNLTRNPFATHKHPDS